MNMSRIGKQPIKIPENVEVKIDGNLIFVKGPKGELTKNLPDKNISIEQKEGSLVLAPKDKSRQTRALWGTYRALINNMLKGVSEGFEKTLLYEGIGFKAEVKSDASVESGKVLELNLGFSHPVKFVAPPGIDFKLEKGQISILGTDKELVGQIAANIRKIRPPEPYKGKGIRYKDEVIIKKAGKKAVAAG